MDSCKESGIFNHLLLHGCDITFPPHLHGCDINFPLLMIEGKKDVKDFGKSFLKSFESEMQYWVEILGGTRLARGRYS